MLKTVSSITNALGALNYKGTWNASTNTPTLASGVGTKGDYYVVSVTGTTNLDGVATWYVGDWATFNGSTWQRLEGGVDDPAPSLKSNSSTGLMQISGPSAGQTRTVTIPDANATMLYDGGPLGTPSSGVLTNCTFPTLNQNTTGSANSVKSNATTGLMQIAGPAAGQTRTVTVPDANATMARTDAAQSFTGTQTFNGNTVSLLDVYGKQIMSGTGSTSPFIITITGLLGQGQGDTRSQQRLTLVSVYTSGPSHVGHAFALYTNEFNGNAILIATLGSSVVGGSIVFGVSGVNPTATVVNSGGTVNYLVNAIPLV